MLVETVTGKSEPADYMVRDPTGNPAADIVIFTPAAARPDPCEAMRKQTRK
jgi:hypothetical protein